MTAEAHIKIAKVSYWPEAALAKEIGQTRLNSVIACTTHYLFAASPHPQARLRLLDLDLFNSKPPLLLLQNQHKNPKLSVIQYSC